MPTYTVKTTFPADEAVDGKKYTTTKRVEEVDDLDAAAVSELFNSYRNSGYSVNTTFKTPEATEDGEDKSPFQVAESLTRAGIDYKATLKLKSKGAYSDMEHAFKLIEANGFDMTVTVQLKINDKTTLDVDHSDTYQDEDAVFKCTPKASSDDVNELKSLYESLANKGYDVTIDIKPKKAKANDMEQEDQNFSAQLAAYPSGTEVDFTLSQDEA